MALPPALSKAPVRALLYGLAVGAVLLAVLVVTLMFLRDVVPDAEAERVHDSQVQAADIAAARAAIVARVSDATTVTFGKVTVNWLGEAPAVCGDVDIDEVDDGLDGDERFVFVAGVLTLESQDGSDAVGRRWREVCE